MDFAAARAAATAEAVMARAVTWPGVVRADLATMADLATGGVLDVDAALVVMAGAVRQASIILPSNGNR